MYISFQRPSHVISKKSKPDYNWLALNPWNGHEPAKSYNSAGLLQSYVTVSKYRLFGGYRHTIQSLTLIEVVSLQLSIKSIRKVLSVTSLLI